ncbi:fumarylacetoacetate hydrolase family protein [Pseudophaeobacter flagellatus]|uniref:fumarylacetoacetate hydrolase family protein n=1 Tax=Pseudophaeobacter flagellatus TaxID=2899119 RepID=UPI001E4A06C9|nr:fumarylacetoacetate hydrolase family protein [Pseudophaeobacter flagellatus]MCD9146525.1 fumarylacetoacetate hydrolase family protein [Pseudophaeobacter flagellatus]
MPPLEFGLDPNGLYLGRLWRPGIGPCLVTLRDKEVWDITSPAAATLSALLEADDIAAYLDGVKGTRVCTLAELEYSTYNQDAPQDRLRLLPPCDLQAVKAAGVTFARSMIERVIEERAAGDATRASEIRTQVAGLIGGSLQDITPGSEAAARVKALLEAENLWSQYLEVGIGPDAEVFTKAQPLSAVGTGAEIGLHPDSGWNNPEPEIVLAVSSTGTICGATLGNDVNLRDVEGRSALLLGKAKDNNASAAIGPFIRIFDQDFGLADIKQAEILLQIKGAEDGFSLEESCAMREISRQPESIVAQTLGPHHQYPDGMMLYLGSMFAPIQDRDEPGQGFTHKLGDQVTISTPLLGTLSNRINLSNECPAWSFGMGALMKNLAKRQLL